MSSVCIETKVKLTSSPLNALFPGPFLRFHGSNKSPFPAHTFSPSPRLKSNGLSTYPLKLATDPPALQM